MENLIKCFADRKTGYVQLDKMKNVDIEQPSMFRQRKIFEFDGKKYFFKGSGDSGGVFEDKEIYESFISRLIRKYTPSVVYAPAICAGEPGVVCEHWGKNYAPFKEALAKKKGTGDKLYIGSVEEFEAEYFDGMGGKPLKDICTEDCLTAIQKTPIQLMAGNYDFKLSNMAVNTRGPKLSRLTSFDYGFNIFNTVEKTLKEGHLELNGENITLAINNILRCWFGFLISFGGTKNCSEYEDWGDLTYDFYNYAYQNPEFKKYIEQSLDMVDNVDEVSRELKFYHMVLPKYRKDLIKRVMHYVANEYEALL